MTPLTPGLKNRRMIEIPLPQKLKVVTFDLDNTLWDVEPALRRAEHAQREWLLQHRPGAIEHYQHEALWKFKQSVWKRHPHLSHQISKLRIQMLYELQVKAGYTHDRAKRGAELAFAAFLEQRHAVVLYEEALLVLEYLAKQYTLGALTNGNANIYKTDAADYFDFAFLAEDIGIGKPAADMFHAALEQTGVHADEVVHVGDSPEHDIAGAQAVGIRTIWMNSGNLAWPGGVRADGEINNLSQLPDAIAKMDTGV